MEKIIKDISVSDEFKEGAIRENRRNLLYNISPMIVLLCITAFFSIIAPSFVSIKNFFNILNQAAIPLVLSLGLTFVVLTGSIDLSIEGLMCLSGTAVGFLVANNKNDLNLGVLAVIIIMCLGAACGFISGIIVNKGRIPSFMVTFGISSVAYGFAKSINSYVASTILDMSFRSIALEKFGSLYYMTWIALGLFIIAYIVQEKTAFGRHLYAIGANEAVSITSGINVTRVKITTYIWSGVLISIAGIMSAANIGKGTSLIAINNSLFPSLTAVVVGGTSLSGGKGGVINTLFGVLTVTVFNNGLIMCGIQPELQQGMQSLIILIAVSLSVRRSRKLINK